jgi:glycine cleavage system aminomethyltransferase T
MRDALVHAVREGAGLFPLSSRGVIEVGGGERVRWLNAMVTNDIEALDAASSRSGCYALLLTREGRLVADLQVLAFDDALVLEGPRAGEVLAAATGSPVSLEADAWTEVDLSGVPVRVAELPFFAGFSRG